MSPTPPPATENEKQPPKKRRRLLRWTLYLLAAAVVLRVLLGLAMPWLVRWGAGFADLAADYERMQLSLLGGHVQITQLKLHQRDAEGEADPERPLLFLEHADVDVDVSALLTGTLRVHTVEVDGLQTWVERTAEEDAEETPAEPPAESDPATDEGATGDGDATAEPAPLELGLPVQIDRLRIQHVQVHVRDTTVEPGFDGSLHADLHASHLGHPQRPGSAVLLVRMPGVLDALDVRVEGQSGGAGARARLDVALDGLRLPALRGYLRAAGIAPHAARLDFGLHSELTLEPTDETGTAASGGLQLADLALRADGAEAVALDAVEVDVASLTNAALHIPRIALRGLRAAAGRTPRGVTRVAGLDLGGAAPTAAPAAAEPEAEAAPPAVDPAPRTFDWRIDEIAVSEAAARFTDGAVQPEVDLTVRLDALTATDITAALDQPIAVDAALLCDGLAALTAQARLQLQPNLTASATLRGERVAFDAIAPYLAAAGLQPTLRGGTLELALEAAVETDPATATTRARVALRDLALRGEQPLLQLGHVVLDDVVAAPGRVRLGEIDIAGLQLPVRVVGGGSVALLGLRTVPANDTVAAPAPETTADAEPRNDAAPPPTASPPLRLEIGHLHWRDSAIAFVDESRVPAPEIDTRDVGVEIRDLVIGGDTPTPPATVRAWLVARDVTESLQLTGQVQSRPGPLDLTTRLALRGTGLRAGPLTPYLDAAGIESTLRAASLAADIEATVRATDDGIAASAAVTEVALRDGDDELAAIDSLRVDGVAVGPRSTDIDSVALAGVRLRAAREADGALAIAGIRLPPPATGGVPDVVPEAAAGTGEDAGPTPSAPAATPPAAQTQLRLAELRIDGVDLQWQDAAVTPAVDTALQLAVALDGLALGGPATPAALRCEVAVRDAIEQLRIEGEVTPDPEDLGVALDLALRGARADALRGYLPPQTPVTLRDGRLRLRLEATAAMRDDGARAVEVALTDIDYRDGDTERPLLGLDAVRLAAPRLDADAGVYEIAEVSLRGLQLDATRSADGALHVLGLELPATPPAPGEGGAGPTPTGEEAAPSPGFRAVETARRPTRAAPLPRVELGAFEVDIAALTFVDETQPGSTPLVARARLATPAACVLLAEDPVSLPPLQLGLDLEVEPVLGALDVDVVVSPFADPPGLEVTAAARGLRGAGLTEVLPALTEQLDASGIDNGSVDLHLQAHLLARRRGPAELDLERGFGIDLVLDQLALRAVEDGPVVAGIGGVQVEVRRINPSTGAVHVQSVEIDTPTARITQRTDGLLVAGVLLKPPVPPEGEGESDASPAAARPAPRAVAAAAQSEPAPEFRLDQLLVSGLDVEFRDERAEPAFVLPLNRFDCEVRGFTTRAFEEPVPLRFSADLGAGGVELPERVQSVAFPLGFAQAAVSALTGGEDAVGTESRRVLEELAINGRLSFAPQLEGVVKVNLAGLELPALRGPAAEAGVEIGDGVLDFGTALRFRGAQGLDIDTGITFTHLSIDEPPGGPISTYLQLPAPLDSVLFLLRNEDGEHKLSPSIHIGAAGISAGEIARVAGETLALTIANAVAAAPLRATGMLTDVVGMTGAAEDLDALTTQLAFEPGAPALPADAADTLHRLLAEVTHDEQLVIVAQHQFGAADLELAARRGSPPPDTCHELLLGFAEREAVLQRRRAEAAARARAVVITGQRATPDPSAALRAIESELGELALAREAVLELLAPGAERQRARRAKHSARAVAERRLAEVRDLVVAKLRGFGAELPQTRIEVRKPRLGQVAGEGGGQIVLQARRRQVQ